MRKKTISKEDILKTASDIIALKGIKECSMRNISNELNIAVGTIYNYFPSRNILLEELFKYSWHSTIIKINNIPSLEISSKDKLKEVYLQLKEDILKRNGLGAEVFNKENYDTIEYFKYMKEEIVGVINKILLEIEPNTKRDEELRILSEWNFILIFNHVIQNRDMTDIHFELLFKNI